jgi:molybdopterin molybdotransferase
MLLSVEEARERVLASVRPVDPEDVPVVDTRGLVLATDAVAPHPLQRFDNSAMDGYAVRAEDVDRASESEPVTLSMIGEIRAGGGDEVRVEPGTAARIMTGAELPSGADAVAPIEVAEESDGKVVVKAPITLGQHVRAAGEDIKSGEVVIRAGTELGPGELAVLASLGISPVGVRRGPSVAVLVTGDELVPPEAEPARGQIRDSNTVALRALVEEAGGRVVPFRSVGDDRDATLETLRRAAELSDLVVSTGGVSVGRYDYVRDAVEELGHIDLWRVAMQPGKPLVVGAVQSTPFLGLPGNPVSVHVCFEQFARPAIRKMRGCNGLLRPRVFATLSDTLRKSPGRLQFVRVNLESTPDGWTARPTGPQGSHIQSSLLGANGVAIFERDAEVLDAGAEITVEVWNLPT